MEVHLSGTNPSKCQHICMSGFSHSWNFHFRFHNSKWYLVFSGSFPSNMSSSYTGTDIESAFYLLIADIMSLNMLRLRQNGCHSAIQQVQINVVEWKLLYLDANFTEVCCCRFSWWYVIIGSDNGLVLNRHQAITWTTDEQVLQHHMVSLGHTEFTPYYLTGNSSRYNNMLDNINHWGWMTHICISKLKSIGSDNGLSPGRRQSIIWTNAGILLIGPSRTKLQWNFNQNSCIFVQENAFENGSASMC